MGKNIEQLIKEARILKEAKVGRRKEKIQKVKQTTKDIVKTVIKNRPKYSKTKVKKPSFKKISRAVSYRKPLSSNLMRTFGGGTPSQSSQHRVKEGPGRPRGDYKHRDPQTGQPIPATVFYKRIKELRRQAEQAARIRDVQAIQELGKRGIPPSQAQQIVDTRQLQSIGVQPQQQVIQPQKIPSQLPPEVQKQLFIQQLRGQQSQGQLTPEQIRILQMQRGTSVRPIWRRNPVIGEERGVKKIYGVPQSFWN